MALGPQTAPKFLSGCQSKKIDSTTKGPAKGRSIPGSFGWDMKIPDLLCGTYYKTSHCNPLYLSEISSGAKVKESWQMLVGASSRRWPVWGVLKTGVFWHFILASSKPSDHLYPLHNKGPPAGPQDAREASIVLLTTNDGLFGLKICPKVPAGVGLVHTLHNPRGDGPRPHNPPSTFAQRITSFAGKVAACCRLRDQNVFGGNRANTPRPRSKARAGT